MLKSGIIKIITGRKENIKGQISIYFILGFFFILLVLFFFLSTSLLNPDPRKYHQQNLAIQFDKETLDSYVNFCIQNESSAILGEIGLNGGTLNKSDVEEHSREYYGKKYRLLCVYIEGAEHCINRIITLKEIEDEFSSALVPYMQNCIDFSDLRNKGYNVTTGNLSVSATIGGDTVSVKVDYPIILSKEGFEVKNDEFYYRFNHPIGLAYKLAVDIINHEASYGYFDKDKWMNNFNNLFSINKYAPYPYVIYSIQSPAIQSSTIESSASTDLLPSFAFNFAIQTEDKASRAGRNYYYDLEYGCCYISQECFKNSAETICKQKLGSYEHFTKCSCPDTFIPPKQIQASSTLQQNSNLDCSNVDDGESWCKNFIGTGGRSIKYSCHNGITYEEPCRDFNEEVCVEYSESGKDMAVCKSNRGEDCTKCTTKECCENDILRDCKWLEASMEGAIYYSLFPQDNKKCVPKLAPGFRFWDGAGQEVCNQGTTYQVCNGVTCGNEWVQHVSSYCSMLGDCGYGYNFAGDSTISGFFETDPKYSPKLISPSAPYMTTNMQRETLAASSEQESVNLIPALISAGLNYIDDLGKGKKRVLSYSFCGLWQAPHGGDCSSCNDEGICSEYKCNSLGQDCVYSEENGVPKCSKKQMQNGEMHIFLESSQYNYLNSSMEIEGNTIYGFEITDAIPAYEALEFEIRTSSMTKCKITYMPELSFTETPAIWFGDPVYSYTHNVSFRLPDKIHIPEKIYKNLNVSSISDLFNMIISNDEKLKSLNSEVYGMLSMLYNYSRSREYFIALLNLSVAGIDENKYYTFIRCSDASGKENEEPVFLSFKINDSFNDIRAPRIVYSIPKNNTNVNNDTFFLRIFLDEPSECKYSASDTSFGAMENEFECETSRMKSSSLGGGSYECHANLNIFSPYIRCKDNPPEVNNYMFNLDKGENATPTSYIKNNNDIILTEYNLMSNTTVYLDNDNINSNLYNIAIIIPSNSSCRYGFNGFNYGLMSALDCKQVDRASTYLSYSDVSDDDFICNLSVAAGNYEVYISCSEPEPQNRNINAESIMLNFNHDSGISIVSYFPENEEYFETSIVNLGVVVNKNINENNVNCGYSMNNNGEIYQMAPYGNYQFKYTMYGLTNGTYKAKFTCTDSLGESVSKNTMFFVE